MDPVSQPGAAQAARRRTILDWIVIAGFLAAICAPLADEAIRKDRARGPGPELRGAAPLPRLNWDAHELASFPSRFEAWYDDRFGLRDKLLRWHSIERLFLFGVSPTPRVVIGKDGWMFYTGDSSVDVFRGRLPFRPAQLSAWREELEHRRDELAARGAAFLFVIVPNKETVYPDYMPRPLNKVGPTRLEQLAAEMRAHPQIPFLDLRPAMAAARTDDTSDDFPYIPYGTHWNARGMWAGYAGILDALHDRFPVLRPRPLPEFEIVRSSDNGDSWGRHMYIDDLRPQKVTTLSPLPGPRARVVLERGSGLGRRKVTVVDDPSLPRALLVHDSFGPCVDALLAEHFSRLECRWGNDIDLKLVEAERFDVVIQMFVERALVTQRP
jgi:alginate O-acetyltransferase complex protein AlgJ